MAGNQKSFSWNASTLTTNMSSVPKKLERLIVAAVEYHATRGEAYMRINAKWKDRTSNARNSLNTSTIHSGSSHSIVFAHGMPYGIWLEVRFAGRYAIIGRSVNATGAALMGTLNKGMSRIQ